MLDNTLYFVALGNHAYNIHVAACYETWSFQNFFSTIKMLSNFNCISYNTVKFRGLTTMDMFVDTLICGLQIIGDITKVNTYFVRIFNLWIAQPTKKFKQLNVRVSDRKKSQYIVILWVFSWSYYFLHENTDQDKVSRYRSVLQVQTYFPSSLGK